MATDPQKPDRRSKPRPRPSVLAVVVAHEPGEWFDDCVASLAAQTYERLGVLFVLTGNSATYPALEVTINDHLDVAQVVHAPDTKGYGDAVSKGLAEFSASAKLLLLCHDDVALKPGAVSILVGEALESNAGVVGPKLVDWMEPRVIQSVGFATDKFGTPIPLAERGDLDQEQYDAVDDVFSVASACLLIRTDLYELVGGYDTGMSFYGDDLDLCWRVQAAGARVIVAPDAVVRHRDALAIRAESGPSSSASSSSSSFSKRSSALVDDERLRSRHQLRTVLSGYGGFRTARVVPQYVLLTLVQALAAILRGRVGRLRTIFGAWTWNLSRIAPLLRRRRELAGFRQLPDGDFRELQRGGSYWFSKAVAARIGNEQRESAVAFGDTLRHSSLRVPALLTGVLGLVFLFGSRTLISADIPAVGQLARFDSSPGDLIGEWWSGWWSTGLGTEDPPPFGYAILGIAGYVFLGAMGVLRKLVLLSMLPIGVFGAFSVFKSSGSLRARLATAAVYLMIPVGFNSLAGGSWYGLLSYAAVPWIMLQMGRGHGVAPFREADTGGATVVPQVLRLALLLAVVGAFVPPIWVVLAIMLGGLVLGALVAGSLNGTTRMATIVAPAAGFALALHLPWFLGVSLPRTQWAPLVAAGSSDVGDVSLAQLLLFDTGRFELTTLLIGIAVSASFVLIVGRAWRLVWGIRVWIMSLGAWGVLWVSQFGLLPFPVPAPAVLLPVAAIGMAMAVGLGVLAFEADLQVHNFGWRQVLTVVSALGILVASIPMINAAADGRWNMPRGDIDSRLAFLNNEVTEAEFEAGINQPPDGAYRVLWIGDPEVLPGAGAVLDDQMAFLTTDSGGVDITDQWVGRVDGPTSLIPKAIRSAVNGDSSRLGYALAPMGIRYIVIVERSAPAPFDTEPRLAPEPLLSALSGQLDIRGISTVNRAMKVYVNDAFFPVRSSGLVVDPASPRPDAPVLLTKDGATTFKGRVESEEVVFVANAPSSGWELEVGGVKAPKQTAFGWANSFQPESGGDAVLSFNGSPVWLLARLGQLAGWLVLTTLALGLRSRNERRRVAVADSTHMQASADVAAQWDEAGQ